MVNHRKKLTPKNNRNGRGRKISSRENEAVEELNMEAEVHPQGSFAREDGVVPEKVADNTRYVPWTKDPLPDNFVCR